MRSLTLAGLLGLAANLLLLGLPVSPDSMPKESEFVYARVRYHLTEDAWQVREVPWHHDYPYSDEMFPTVLSEVTNVRTSRDSYKVVDIDSPELFKFPFAYLCEPGFIELTPKDVANLKKYLDRGVFSWSTTFEPPSLPATRTGDLKTTLLTFRRK
jgi:hypothetical protein